MTRFVAVVAHTHWDREWYAPHETFQARLTDVLDEVLAVLDADPSFERFLLDGQVAIVDDYLRSRPAARDALRRLVGEGRLLVGPWYVLMDEFCVSGETLVRNLQLGLRRGQEFGGTMPVGYLPDMFGHVAQMPQLLRLAGFEHAVVWRGVPAAINRTGFWWEAPDGSTVRAEYLPVGYANGAYLPDDPGDLVRRIAAHDRELRPWLGDASDPLLLMNGTDQQRLQPRLPALLTGANQIQDQFEFGQVSLLEYLAGAPDVGLPRWCGELRSGARANLLMGVLSNRVDVKTAAAVAERELERLAEPLAALWLPACDWPAALLDDAWLEVVRNSAHDSVCACSADSVGRAVIHRYDAAIALARVVTNRALELAEVATVIDGPMVVNPRPGPAGGTVEVVLSGTDPVPDAQVLASAGAGTEVRRGVGADFARLIGQLSADGWLPGGRGTDAEILHSPDGLDVVITVDPARRPSPQLASVMAEAWAQAGAGRDTPLSVRVERRSSQRVVARAAQVPGYGWAAFRPQPLGPDTVRAGPGWLENSLVRVDVDPESGTFALNGLTGLNRLVDDGDEGDTYNHSAPDHDTVIDRPDEVEVQVLEPGPVRAILRILRRFTWPAAVAGGHRVGRSAVEVISDIELHAAEDLVRVTTCFDNPCRDHRLRAWFPLPEHAASTVAECAFATVRRGNADGGPHEAALATYPSRRFVTAGSLMLTHEGLLEYELVEQGTALALTLLRCTGVLSRPAPSARPNPAGPPDPLEGPQMLGPQRMRYAVAVGPRDPWRVSEEAWTPLQVVHSAGAGALPAAGSRLTVRGGQVSALRRADGNGALELRVFNPTAEPATVDVVGHSGWVVNLRGERLQRWVDRVELRPWGIATLHFDAATLDP